MFRPKILNAQPAIHADWREELSEDELIAGLRQYVSKNRSIPEKFTEFEQKRASDLKLISDLTAAILSADFAANAFSHPDAELCLLYMVENKIIPYWQGISAYVYLMVLSQFSDRRNMRAEDADVKCNRPHFVRNLVSPDGTRLSDFGTEYFRNIGYAFSLFGIDLDQEKLQENVLKLPAFERHVIEITNMYVAEGDSGRGIYKMLETLKGVVLFCMSGKYDAIYLPSTSLINYLLSCISDRPMQMLPILGVVNDRTLQYLHAKDQHVVALYSNAVKSNLRIVHDDRCGPIAGYLHDIGHVLWSSFLDLGERELLQTILLPTLRQVYMSRVDDDFARRVNNFASALCDYNLTPLKWYRDKKSRFSQYLIVMSSKIMKIDKSNFSLFKDTFLPAMLRAERIGGSVAANSEAVMGLKVFNQYLRESIDGAELLAALDKSPGSSGYSPYSNK